MAKSRLIRAAGARALLRGGHQGARGQALMIAVLVLFAVATLAALFAAIVGSQISQVARHTDVVALRNIARAGLRFANEQLTYSVQGADWRPSTEAYRCGRGEVRLQVTYGPVPDNLQSQFIRIVATAIFPDNPFLRHTVLALKPMLLTDYARFITDRFETNREAWLGVPGVELGGVSREDYLFRVDGPVRSNTDLMWYGPSALSLYTHRTPAVADSVISWYDLGVLRDDRIEVAGRLEPRDLGPYSKDVVSLYVDGARRAENIFWPTTSDEQQSYLQGFPLWGGDGGFLPHTQRVLADLPVRDFPPQFELYPIYQAVPRVRPPSLDAAHPDTQVVRYLALTRDSGRWRRRMMPSGVYGWYNPGAHGWGWADMGGIYIDNRTEIQQAHDLEGLRIEWTARRGGYWDKTGRHYLPPGVEIVIHGELDCPVIEIIRHDLKEDGSGNPYYWSAPDGQPILASSSQGFPYSGADSPCHPLDSAQIGVLGARAIFPFPANGIIYAEGNVRVRGVMPRVRHNPQTYFDVDHNLESDWGRSRRYDLQIVSGGSIYIEGDIIGYQEPGLIAYKIQDDALLGSRLALLARDHVCVNTTAFQPRPRDLDITDVRVYPPDWHPQYFLLRGPEFDDSMAIFVGEGPQPTVPPKVDFTYHNVRLEDNRVGGLRELLPDLRLLIGHSGWYQFAGDDGAELGPPPAPVTSDAEPHVEVQFKLGEAGDTWLWEHGGERYTFYRPDYPTLDVNQEQSAHWSVDPTISHRVHDDYLEFLPSRAPETDQYMRLQDLTVDPPRVWPAAAELLSVQAKVYPVAEKEENVIIGWEVAPQQLGYIFGPLAVAPPNRVLLHELLQIPDPLPIEIEALVYAQNGSWFIIPGPWFNEDPDDAVALAAAGGEYTTEAPGYHEPLNIQITFRGAISENMPASPGAVGEWTSKWCGPAGQSAGFLWYEYDALLRRSRQSEDGRSLPRFPNLPLTSDLLIWGERVSGGEGT